jgi:16S rRNA (uracil1498-N3)-methyltransferase
MSERFFSSHPITADRVKLDGPEAHHLLHVMRAAAGDQVTLFDGSGAEFSAVVESLHRSEVEVRIVARLDIDRELPFPLTIGVALPKGDRQKWLVEKLTELGVTTIVPLVTERGVAQPVAGLLDRLRRAVIEAAKQCGRNRLLQIAKPQAWDEWISRADGVSPDTHRLIAHPGGAPLGSLNVTERLATYIAIGPEGGFADAEITMATAAGWQLVDLGPRILRVETAAVALTAAVVAASSSS